MTNRRRRKQKKSSFTGDIFRFIMAIIMIVIAVFVVAFVAGKVRGILGSMKETPEGPTRESQSELEISNEPTEAGEGFYQDEEGNTRWHISEEEGDAEDLWIPEGEALYYFNDKGIMQTGVKGMEGMIYTFSQSGKLEKISYNPDYTPDPSTVLKDYPSLAKSKKLWAFLGEGTLGEFRALMYKKTTEAMAHQLGGDKNPQYTSPYSMQIDGDYIYFLPLSDKEELSSEEEELNGTLFRMKPGDEVRQIVAEDVEGYKVLDGSIWYYSKGSLHKTETARDDSRKNKPKKSSGEEVYYVEVRDGAASLLDEYGDPVTSESGEVKGRGFTYYLNSDGTIRGVNQKTTVNTGGYTYYAEGDTAFGSRISRIMRKDADGRAEIISAEFPGKVGNFRYDYNTGNMVAEYTDGNGVGGVIIISKSGDVDRVADESAGTGSLTILALQEGEALCMKEGSGGQSFVSLDLQSASPLAVGVDPIPEGEAVISDDPGESAAATVAPTRAPETVATEGPGTDQPVSPQPTAPEEGVEIGGPGISGVEVGGAPL